MAQAMDVLGIRSEYMYIRKEARRVGLGKMRATQKAGGRWDVDGVVGTKVVAEGLGQFHSVWLRTQRMRMLLLQSGSRGHSSTHAKPLF